MRHLWVVLAFALPMGAQAQPLSERIVPIPVSVPNEEGSQQVPMPVVPSFTMPAPNPDGTHSVRELVLRSSQYLETEVAVRGVVTWVYDCALDVRTPKMTDKEVEKAISDNPTLCERPKLYLGDTATTSPELSAWVVAMPRPYTSSELKRIAPKDRTDPTKCDPADASPAKQICGPYNVGDQLEIIGTWTLRSPHGDSNPNGLLVYKRMKNLTQRWETPGPAPLLAKPPAPARWVEPALRKPAWRTLKAKAKDLSTADQLVADGVTAYQSQRYDDAAALFMKATSTLKEHHQAWYWLSRTQLAKQDFTAAVQAARSAVTLAPVVAIYQQLLGRAVYEDTIEKARTELAVKLNRRPEVAELGPLDLSAALEPLRLAVASDPNLWRSHYLIGEIHRNAGRAALAARALTRACALGPHEPEPYRALVELYRRWGYFDQAIGVLQPAILVMQPNNALTSRLRQTLGLVFEEARQLDKAIDAYTEALSERDLSGARFGRGRAYFARGDHAKARPDLEAFRASSTASTASTLQRTQATQMLLQIAKATRP